MWKTQWHKKNAKNDSCKNETKIGSNIFEIDFIYVKFCI